MCRWFFHNLDTFCLSRNDFLNDRYQDGIRNSRTNVCRLSAVQWSNHVGKRHATNRFCQLIQFKVEHFADLLLDRLFIHKESIHAAFKTINVQIDQISLKIKAKKIGFNITNITNLINSRMMNSSVSSYLWSALITLSTCPLRVPLATTSKATSSTSKSMLPVKGQWLPNSIMKREPALDWFPSRV